MVLVNPKYRIKACRKTAWNTAERLRRILWQYKIYIIIRQNYKIPFLLQVYSEEYPGRVFWCAKMRTQNSHTFRKKRLSRIFIYE